MSEHKYGDLLRMLSGKEIFKIPENRPYFPYTSTRCIEIPLVFSAIGSEKKILDIGTSLADPLYFYGLLLLVQEGHHLHGLDIVPMEKVMNRFQQFDAAMVRKFFFIQEDIRHCTIASESYNLILCVSVLEHVGFDKYIDSVDTVFDRPVTPLESVPDFLSLDDDSLGLNEMVRLLEPGGRLLLTVPFGAGGVFFSKDSKGCYATYLEYNKEKWIQLKKSIRQPVTVNERVFQMLPKTGWMEVNLETVFPLTKQCDIHVDQGLLCVEIVRLPSD